MIRFQSKRFRFKSKLYLDLDSNVLFVLIMEQIQNLENVDFSAQKEREREREQLRQVSFALIEQIFERYDRARCHLPSYNWIRQRGCLPILYDKVLAEFWCSSLTRYLHSQLQLAICTFFTREVKVLPASRVSSSSSFSLFQIYRTSQIDII